MAFFYFILLNLCNKETSYFIKTNDIVYFNVNIIQKIDFA